MVAAWRAFTRGPFSLRRVEGHHLFPLDAAGKAGWLEAVVAELKPLVKQ